MPLSRRLPVAMALAVATAFWSPAAAQSPDAPWEPISAVGGGLFGVNGAPAVAGAVDDTGRLYAVLLERQAGISGGRLARWDGTAWTVFSGWVALPAGSGIGALCVSPTGDAVYFVGRRLTTGSDGTNGTVAFSNAGRFDVAADAWDTGFVGLNDTPSDCGVDTAGRLYAAGSFTDAGGTALDGVGRWDPATRAWSAVGAVPGTGARALAVEPDGSVVLGLNPLQRFDATTGTWAAVGPAFDAGALINHLETDGTRIYAAGLAARGGVSDLVFQWDGAQWTAYTGVTSPFPPRSFALDGNGTVYLLPDGPPPQVYERALGAPGATRISENPSEIYGFVAATPRWAATGVYLGGTFSTVGLAGATVPANNLAAWDGAVWSALRAQGSGTQGVVHAVESIEPREPYAVPWVRAVAVGGDLTQVNYRAVNKVALFDGNAWNPMGGGVTDPAGTVRAFTSEPSTVGRLIGDYDVYVGGQFNEVTNRNGTPVSVSNVAFWSMSSQEWGSLGGGVSVGGVPGTGIVNALQAAYDGDVSTRRDYIYVGGLFDTATNADGSTVAVNNLARYSRFTGQWEAVAGGVDGPVYALELTPWFQTEVVGSAFKHGLVVGGDFAQARDASGVAVPDTPNIVRLTSHDEWAAVGRGTNGPVHALAFRGVPLSGFGGVASVFNEVLESRSILYVGGDFTAVTDGPSPVPGPVAVHPVGYLAKWMPGYNRWDRFGPTPLDNGVNAPVRTLAFDDARSARFGMGVYSVVVGGDFTEAWSEGTLVPVNRLALLVDALPTTDLIAGPDSGPGQWATETFENYGGGADDVVRDLAVTSCPQFDQFALRSFVTSAVYPGGDFQTVGTQPAQTSASLARWRSVVDRSGRGRFSYTVVGATPACTAGCRLFVGRVPGCYSAALGRRVPTEFLAEVGYGGTVGVDADTLASHGQAYEVALTDGGGTSYRLADLYVERLDAPALWVLSGVDDPSQYAPNPEGAEIGFQMRSVNVPPGLPGAPFVRVVHAATDAPAVDVVLDDGTVVADSVGYGSRGTGALVAVGAYTAEVRRHADGAVLATLPLAVPDGAGAIAVVLSGFLDPSANQDGPGLSLQTIELEEGASVRREEPRGEAGLALRLAPNPVWGAGTVRFEVPDGAPATVDVIDALGRRVAVLHDGPVQDGGHAVAWDAGALASGVYLVRLRAAAGSIVRAVTVVR